LLTRGPLPAPDEFQRADCRTLFESLREAPVTSSEEMAQWLERVAGDALAPVVQRARGLIDRLASLDVQEAARELEVVGLKLRRRRVDEQIHQVQLHVRAADVDAQEAETRWHWVQMLDRLLRERDAVERALANQGRVVPVPLRSRAISGGLV
ncbi:MAG TPA: hypothetical protein VIN09_07145, partial [Chloroflexota bacterium]